MPFSVSRSAATILTSPSTSTVPAAADLTSSSASTIRSPAVTPAFSSTSLPVEVRLTTPVASTVAPTVTVSADNRVTLVGDSSAPIAPATVIVDPASAVRPN